jgi:hypothetical protein
MQSRILKQSAGENINLKGENVFSFGQSSLMFC